MKKKFHKIVFYTLTIFNVILLCSCANNSNDNIEDAFFIKNNSFLCYSINKEYTLDFTYFFDKSIIGFDDTISEIKLIDCNLISINNYTIREGDTTKKYNSRTLSLSVSAKERGEEVINSIRILFENGEEKDYSIGSWHIRVEDVEAGEHIQLIGKYPAVTNRINKVNFSLKNNSSTEVLINDIIFSPNSSNFESITLVPSKTHEFKITMDKGYYGRKYGIVKPKVIYSISNKEYSYYLPRINFGYLEITDESIEEEKDESIEGNIK